jgi:hypothetical protein
MLRRSNWPRWCVLAVWVLATVSVPMACRERGPAEEAGRDLDRGIEDLGREIEDIGRGR